MGAKASRLCGCAEEAVPERKVTNIVMVCEEMDRPEAVPSKSPVPPRFPSLRSLMSSRKKREETQRLESIIRVKREVFLSPHQCALVQLSWRCITIGEPNAREPGSSIMENMFAITPAVKAAFGFHGNMVFSQDDVYWEDTYSLHCKGITKMLDFVVLNVYDLHGEVSRYLEGIGQKHLKMSSSFKQEFFGTFYIATMRFISDSLHHSGHMFYLLRSFEKNTSISEELGRNGVADKSRLHDLGVVQTREAWGLLLRFILDTFLS